MSSIIAQHFTDELKIWSDAIHFNNGLSSQLEDRLEEVIRRNSIVDIAAKVEVHQTLLNTMEEKFTALEDEILKQHDLLTENDSLIDDSQININMQQQQLVLGEKIKNAEKEFVDIKFYCNAFLSQILNQKKH